MTARRRVGRWRLALLGAIVWGGLFPAWLAAQDPSDVVEFLAAGKKAYEKGDLAGAAVEFENVLLLEPRHFEAKVWLVQIYIDRKQVDKARKLLTELQRQAPGHARVTALARLLGADGGAPASAPKESDLVVYETLTLIGSGTRLRPYGLVVPEGKVAKPRPPGPADDEVPLSLGGEDDEVSSGAALTGLIADEGPLGPVFERWAEEGLNSALEKYFEIILARRDLMSMDDRGLLRKGMETYQPKLEANPQDREARFYLGMIYYLNGLLDDARQTLEPLRKDATPYDDQLAPVLADLDRKKAEEEARLAAIQKEKEAQEAARAAERARREAAAIAANLGGGSASTASPTGPLNPADVLHNEGYDLYKKGQLDQAIEKFQAAIAQNDREPKYYYHMGLALTDKGLAGHLDAFDRAMEAFNKVISLEPGGKMAKDSEVMIRDIVAAKKSLKN
ncbi:MAG: hypothetical protein OZSIB_4187 [Candidatus Ozemobacter sibiricus]|uniref:Tetratricopeptide repeat protein n=1 Tax=Candidatus Ozemobacter sibiricus TaxID=2268124 RepID=A0A367ZNL3_9BACT|nr:MAG: hypothetical protein OZSIB_4187 [Candidatus Ozemobacter sibiricus]